MGKEFKGTPLHNRVVVKPSPSETKTAGGIIIPDTAQEKSQSGTIVAIGNGIDQTMETNNLLSEILAHLKGVPHISKTSLSLKVGDQVIFSKYAGTEIEQDGEMYLMMRDSDIQIVN